MFFAASVRLESFQQRVSDAEGIQQMDYREDQTIVDFRNEVQTFISDNLPDDWGSGSRRRGL